MSFTDDILNDDVSAYQVAMRTDSGAYNASGNWQNNLLNIGSNFVNGLMQVELLKRAREAQGPTITSNQAPIYTDNTTRAAAAIGRQSLGDVLPFLLLGLGAWALMRGR